MTGESGSLAGINLPQSVSNNTYTSTNQILKWNSQPATMDSASNLTSDPVTNATYTWDSRNQLSGIGPSAAFSATYDALMRRYSQTTPYGGTTTYLHDQKNVAQSTTTNAPPNPINNYLTIPGTGEVLAFTTTNGGTYVPLQDGQGSALGLVNSSNALQTQYTYDPFGNVTTSGQASAYPYLFAGMELDSSGLYHTQTRYYSPTFGRFLTADAGLPANVFSYADDDPVNAIDPSGRTPEYVSGAAGSDVGFSESYTPGAGFSTGVGIATPQIGISCNDSTMGGTL